MKKLRPNKRFFIILLTSLHSVFIIIERSKWRVRSNLNTTDFNSDGVPKETYMTEREEVRPQPPARSEPAAEAIRKDDIPQEPPTYMDEVILGQSDCDTRRMSAPETEKRSGERRSEDRETAIQSETERRSGENRRTMTPTEFRSMRSWHFEDNYPAAAAWDPRDDHRR